MPVFDRLRNMSESQYEVLKPYVNDRILSLVRGRLFDGVKFFDERTLRPEYSRAEVKLALLLVRIANPSEPLNSSELAILEGGQRQNNADKPQTSADNLQFNAGKKKSKNQ